jgi:hypothetical protein
MADLGLHHTHLADYIRTEEWSVRRTLRTTPADMVKLLTDMAKHKLIDEAASNKMIAILEGQQINTLLPAPLPADVLIAHKTGSFNDTLNDVGIVFGPEPYVIAVMTTDLPSLDSGRSFIHQISRMAFTRMNQLAQWRAENAPPIAPIAAQAAPAAAQDESSDVPMWGTAPAAVPAASPAPAATP